MNVSVAFRFGLAFAALCLGLAPVATAHAWLLEAHPGPNQQIPNPPDVLFIRFTENVEREYTRAEVYDVNGTRVDLGDVVFDEAKRNEILVPLGNLTEGIYTVRWYSLSVDTHTAQGSYVFAVGSASLAGAPPPSSSHSHGEGSLPVWLEGVARGFHYAAAAAAIGMPFFALLIAGRPLNSNLPTMLRVLAVLAAGGVLGAATVLFAFSQRIDSTFAAVASAPFGSVGSLLAIRLALQVVLLFAVLALVLVPPASRAVRPLLGSLMTIGAAIVWTTSQSSHAASLSEDRFMAVGADFLHLVAGSVWVGGVAAFLLLARHESREELARWIHRFSPLAIGCVMFIVLTGVYATTLHLRNPSDFISGQYGAMILLKILLLLPLVALGGFNRYVAKRRLTEGMEWRPRNLRRALMVETILMASVLVAAGVLATSAPPRAETDVPDAPTALKFEKSLSKAHMVFTISPAPIQVGLHNYTLELHRFEGENPPGSEMFLQFTPPGRPKSDELHFMKRVSADRWTLDGGFLTERGEWTVHVTVQTDEYKINEFKVNVQ